MGIFHSDADLSDEREDNQRSDCVGDESSEHEDHSGEDNQDAVETKMLDFICDCAGNVTEETR